MPDSTSHGNIKERIVGSKKKIVHSGRSTTGTNYRRTKLVRCGISGDLGCGAVNIQNAGYELA